MIEKEEIIRCEKCNAILKENEVKFRAEDIDHEFYPSPINMCKFCFHKFTDYIEEFKKWD